MARQYPATRRQATRPGLERSGICNCGCGLATPIAQKTDHRCGHIKGEPTYFVPGHSRRFDLSRLPIDKLDTGYDDDSPCLVWVGGGSRKGYGMWGGQTAHRRMYELHHGPLDPSLTVHHKCRVKRCVNIDHLVALSAQEHADENFLTRVRDLERFA